MIKTCEFTYEGSLDDFISAARLYFRYNDLPVKLVPSSSSLLIFEIKKAWFTSKLYFSHGKFKDNGPWFFRLVDTKIAAFHRPFVGKLAEQIRDLAKELKCEDVEIELA